MSFQVAIDGPCGSGKSTVAKAIAKELGFIYIDTGAMYRAVGLYAINKGMALNDYEGIKQLLDEIDISITYIDFTQKIYMNGQDVTKLIRTQIVADASSKVAVIDEVRKKMVEIQRNLAKDNSVIMDGRDIGSHVLPDADIKIYLDASVEARTKRRCSELEQMCNSYDFNTIKQEIEKRDNNDMNREHSPLKKVEDSIVIDTSEMNFDEVKAAIMEIVASRR